MIIKKLTITITKMILITRISLLPCQQLVQVPYSVELHSVEFSVPDLTKVGPLFDINMAVMALLLLSVTVLLFSDVLPRVSANLYSINFNGFCGIIMLPPPWRRH